MSYVTNVILHLGIVMQDEEEKQKLSEVNAFFEHQSGFVSVKDEALPRGWYGGNKYLEASIAIGAFNYLDLNGLIKHLRGIDWWCAEDVQLIVKRQNDDKFEIVDVFGYIEGLDEEMRVEERAREQRGKAEEKSLLVGFYVKLEGSSYEEIRKAKDIAERIIKTIDNEWDVGDAYYNNIFFEVIDPEESPNDQQ